MVNALRRRYQDIGSATRNRFAWVCCPEVCTKLFYVRMVCFVCFDSPRVMVEPKQIILNSELIARLPGALVCSPSSTKQVNYEDLSILRFAHLNPRGFPPAIAAITAEFRWRQP